MEAAKRSASSAGLSTFLVEHESCGAGFDISHPGGLGNGRLRFTCRACGSSFEYAPGLAPVRYETIEREIELEPVTATVTPLPVSRPGTAEAPPGPPPEPGRGFPRERIVTAALLLFALAAVVFAGIRLAQSGDDDSGPSGAPAPAPAAEAPAVTPAPQPSPEPRPAGGNALVRNPLYSLVLPAAWVSRRGAGGATVYSPTGASPSASVEVFYERNPTIDRAAMAAATRDFLASRPGGAAVGPPRFLRSGGDPAFELQAARRGGSETALGVLSGPYRYLVIAAAADRAAAADGDALRRALTSFRAR